MNAILFRIALALAAQALQYLHDRKKTLTPAQKTEVKVEVAKALEMGPPQRKWYEQKLEQ